MKLIDELIEFALRHNMLTEENKQKLQEEGFYTFQNKPLWELLVPQIRPVKLTWINALHLLNDDFLKDIWGKDFRSFPTHIPRGRHVKPKLSGAKLNQLVLEEWDQLTEQFPMLQPIWDSWKAGKLAQVLADGYTLNDVYSLFHLELRDYLDYSGNAPTGYYQLLRKKAPPSKYPGLRKHLAVMRMIEFSAFQQKIIKEVKMLCLKDRKTFASLSSQDGKLDFPSWEKSVQTDTTSMRVWTILDLKDSALTKEKIDEILTWKTALAFAMQIDLDKVAKLVTSQEKED
ncbi:MAG: hypothetical protein K6C40_13570 [Thermoguttaceae bacterium]|nr:hypothetical protein [Thermoguttaceae bacterium]